MQKTWRVYVNAGGTLQHFHTEIILPEYPSYEQAVEDLKVHFQVKARYIKAGQYEFSVLPSLMMTVI